MKKTTQNSTGFIRNKSGLIREFKTYDVFVFNVIAYAIGLVLAVTPTFLGGLHPNANIYIVLTIGVILSIFNGITYGLFSAAMPRSGGDYVFIGRTLKPWIGFTANWGLTWSQFLGIGVYSGWCVTEALSPSLITFGHLIENKSIVDIGNLINEPKWVFIIGTILLSTVLFISIKGMRALKLFLNSFFIVAILGVLAILFVLLSSSNAEFIARFNEFMLATTDTQDAYNSIIGMAVKEGGLKTNVPTDIWSSIMALPVGYWVFIGFTFSVYVGGEVRKPEKSQTIGILGSLIFGYIIYMVVLGTYYEVVGKDFNNALAIVMNLEDNPLPAGGSMTFIAGLLSESIPLSLLISFSVFLWFYLLLFIMAQVCVRNVFAWSVDRLLPEKFTAISEKNGAPWFATIAIIGMAEVFLILHSFLGIGFINYIALFSVCFLIAGVAAIVFPYNRKDQYNSAPSLVRKKILGIPLLVIAGVGNVVLFSVVLYSALVLPGFGGVEGIFPTIFVVLVYLSGAIFYQIVKSGRRKTDIDLDILLEELPPD